MKSVTGLSPCRPMVSPASPCRPPFAGSPTVIPSVNPPHRHAPASHHFPDWWLTYPQLQAVEREAPERIAVPSGNRIAVAYEEGRPPVLAARIQELFGLTETPRVAGGRVKVLLHLLAPNYRPQQVTDDLASFWKNGYPIVRKELRGRYPKHAWPEDPWNAPPERRPRRH